MFLKALGVAFVAAVAFGVVRTVKPDLAVFLPVAAGAIILIMLSDGIVSTVQAFSTLSEKSGLDGSVYASILKIVGIGYLTEYAASLCDDAGCGSVGKKVEFAGKITIILSALPIFTSVLDVLTDLL